MFLCVIVLFVFSLNSSQCNVFFSTKIVFESLKKNFVWKLKEKKPSN